MTTSRPNAATVHDLLTHLRAGSLSALEIVEEALERIQALDPSIQAWVQLDANRARIVADKIDEARRNGHAVGLLAGIPTGIKDTIDVLGFATECGSPVRKGRQPVEDARLVAGLQEADAIILGKTVTSEMAIAVAGPTRNPADLSHTPGASSSGSAAAVAAGMVPFAIGTQTNGSTIRPAAYCGVVGFKPSLGLIPTHGILPHSQLLDHVGIFTQTALDAAIVSEAMIDPSSGIHWPSVESEACRPRLAFIRGPSWGLAGKDTQRRIEDFAGLCPQIIEEIVLPDEFELASVAHRTIMEIDIAQNLGADFRRAQQLMSDRLVSVIESGLGRTQEEYQAACLTRLKLIRMLDIILAGFDAAITPAVTGEAEIGLENSGNPIFATLWTLTGVPAVTLPLLEGPNRLPLGVQIVAARHTDARLLAAARFLETT